MTSIRLPAEWEEQSGVMLTWPRREGDWASNFDAAEKTFLDIARQISVHEKVLIVCSDENQQITIQQQLKNSHAETNNLIFAIAGSNDTWARDHGPITVFENDGLRLLDFIFNGWGGKYPSDLDNKITQSLANKKVFGENIMESINFVLEGGSIESDGQGTLLTTSHCLLSPSRNSTLGKQEIELSLRQHLGTHHILWLNHGNLAGDDTDGHIDTLARFCDHKTIAYVSCDDPDDEHYNELEAMREELEQFRDRDGKAYRLIPLPLPSAKYNSKGKRLPATYANFLIINHAVLVPTYNDSKDKLASSILQECFPERKIINIDCAALIEQFGSLHCVTMQFPAGALN